MLVISCVQSSKTETIDVLNVTDTVEDGDINAVTSVPLPPTAMETDSTATTTTTTTSATDVPPVTS